jgi:hypothetical protein
MSDHRTCPNCGKDAQPFKQYESLMYCNDDGCPVITFDYGPEGQ